MTLTTVTKLGVCRACGGMLIAEAAHVCPAGRTGPRSSADSFPSWPPKRPVVRVESALPHAPVALTACYDHASAHTWLFLLYQDGTVYAHERDDTTVGWVRIAPPDRIPAAATEATDG